MNIDTMQELPIPDRHALIRANGLVSYSYVEAVCIDELDSGLCKEIKVKIGLKNNSHTFYNFHLPWQQNIMKGMLRQSLATLEGE